MKRKLRQFLYEFIKSGGTTAAISAIILAIVSILSLFCLEHEIILIDWSIFSSFIIVMVLDIIGKLLQPILLNRLEDPVKLTTEYSELIEKYRGSKELFLCYDNQGKADFSLLKKINKTDNSLYYFPVICDQKLDGIKIKFQDSKNYYKLPEWVKEHYSQLFSAHKTSKIYNQLNIRVDSWSMCQNRFIINTSRTTYYDSLVTNRAMDYQVENGLTVRDKFAYGPYVSPLETSLLSNHLGFNGFIETSDGFIPFIKRKGDVSIAKHTYGTSVGASLKTMYALNGNVNKKLNLSGVINSMKNETINELKVNITEKNGTPEWQQALDSFFEIEPQLICAYRDVVEGNKPQLLFYAKSTKSKSEITTDYLNALPKKGKHGKRNKSIEQQMLTDGSEIIWIHQQEISQLCISPDIFIWKKHIYPVVPSVSASIIMLIEYLDMHNNSHL